MAAAVNIDAYMAAFPEAVQMQLQQIRETVKKTAPAAHEAIKYGMPAFVLNGSNLVYFAAHKKHIGFYPVPVGHPEFDQEFAAYTTTQKGTIQFEFNKPLPLKLIAKIVKFRMAEMEALKKIKAEIKASSKPAKKK